METRSRWKPDPCAECAKAIICKRSCDDGSLCEEKFHYNHFTLLMQCQDRIQFFRCDVPEWAEMYQVACIMAKQEIEAVREDDFTRAYKRMLIEKFTLSP